MNKKNQAGGKEGYSQEAALLLIVQLLLTRTSQLLQELCCCQHYLLHVGNIFFFSVTDTYFLQLNIFFITQTKVYPGKQRRGLRDVYFLDLTSILEHQQGLDQSQVRVLL